MAIPDTSNALIAAGYLYDNDAICRGCHEPIEWWITPVGKKMPMTVKREGDAIRGFTETREPHWASCPDAQSFRKTRDKKSYNL